MSCGPSSHLARILTWVTAGLFCTAVVCVDCESGVLTIQNTKPPTTTGAQRSDDGFEILPAPVLQHVSRGAELSGLGRLDEAIAEFREAIRVAGRPIFTAYLNMGAVFVTERDYLPAIEALKQALTVRPNSYQAHYNLAEAMYGAEDFVGAEKEYRRVLELSSDLVAIRARHFLGLALYKQRRLDEAIIEYRAAIEQAEGKYAEAHYNLGIALLERKQPAAAEPEFKLAVEQEKSPWPEAQYNLAKAIEEQKRYREAAEAYEVYLKLAPGAADAKRMREYIDYLQRKK
jgi:tetratricopeptide (TPR) repeat protein